VAKPIIDVASRRVRTNSGTLLETVSAPEQKVAVKHS